MPYYLYSGLGLLFYFKLLELLITNSKPQVKLLKNGINIPNKSPVYFFAVSYSLSTRSTSEQLDRVIFGEAAVCPSRFSAHPHTHSHKNKIRAISGPERMQALLF